MQKSKKGQHSKNTSSQTGDKDYTNVPLTKAKSRNAYIIFISCL